MYIWFFVFTMAYTWILIGFGSAIQASPCARWLLRCTWSACSLRAAGPGSSPRALAAATLGVHVVCPAEPVLLHQDSNTFNPRSSTLNPQPSTLKPHPNHKAYAYPPPAAPQLTFFTKTSYSFQFVSALPSQHALTLAAQPVAATGSGRPQLGFLRPVSRGF